MRKYIYSAVLFTVFILFAIYINLTRTVYDVLQVINPFEIVVDFNHSGAADSDEVVKILDGYRFISKDDIKNNKYREIISPDKYPVDDYTLYALAYLSKKFAKDFLCDKKVKIKTINNTRQIFINEENYNERLLNSGYIFKNGEPVSAANYTKMLDYIRRADFKIYNLKNGKYHNLSCEFGNMAHNSVILSSSQLPKGAQPCGYCLPQKHRIKHKKQKPTFSQNPLIYDSGSVKFFLTDYTIKLKPDRYGNTDLCNELAKQINSAEKTIDIAIYGYDRVPKIENAIKRALKRGVKIRLIYDIDSKNSNIYTDTKELALLIKNSKNDAVSVNHSNSAMYTDFTMHDKFFIFDKSIVMTGSANLSHTDMSGFNSNSALLIYSEKIAEIYTKEFEQMYSGKFHTAKNKIPNKENICIGDSILSVYFSPADLSIKNVIIPLINSAKKYIYMPVFIITDKHLASALINAGKRGVDIRIITDATNAKNKYSKHRLLRENGVKVKTENYAGKLHSKSVIIDDKYTVIGSMNFSVNGEKRNDENMIVIKNKAIAQFYKKFFNFLWLKIPDYWMYHDVSAESIYSTGSCSDGIDNDYDGLIDMEDEGCRIKYRKR